MAWKPAKDNLRKKLVFTFLHKLSFEEPANGFLSSRVYAKNVVELRRSSIINCATSEEDPRGSHWTISWFVFWMLLCECSERLVVTFQKPLQGANWPWNHRQKVTVKEPDKVETASAFRITSVITMFVSKCRWSRPLCPWEQKLQILATMAKWPSSKWICCWNLIFSISYAPYIAVATFNFFAIWACAILIIS